ncbi:MAG: apocytochrome f [Cyanobacteriota bacterium]|nr:apocytochrome f [Cyanobacteriota bacterium]
MKKIVFLLLTCLLAVMSMGKPAAAYPAYAQMAYETPREATGKIVCANCHLNQLPTQVEIPQSVTPGQVFDVVVKIPYDHSKLQVTGDGSKGGLNVGSVVVLPEGFRLASEEEMTEAQREEVAETYVAAYSDEKPNILVVGPISGDEHPEIVFPIKAPDPAEDPSVAFMKYYVYVGANRGRGQINPNGSLSNNNLFRSPVTGTVEEILVLADPATDLPPEWVDKVDIGDGYPDTRLITFSTEKGLAAMVIPPGPELVVAVGDSVKEGSPLTNNPNVGGFGQADREIVLQSPDRVKWLIAFLAAVFVAQVMLVLKKKQVELIQAAEVLG